jgi:hypothetical protein
LPQPSNPAVPVVPPTSPAPPTPLKPPVAPAEPPTSLPPPPEGPALEAARSALGDQFGAEATAADTPAKRAAVANKLIQGIQPTADPTPDEFVRLDVAAKLAAEAGDLPLALSAADGLAKRWQIDLATKKAELAIQAAGVEQPLVGRGTMAQACLTAADEALTADAHAAAERLAETALTTARRSGDADLVRRAVLKLSAVREAREAHKGQ